MWLIKLGLPENKLFGIWFLEFPKSFIAIQFFFSRWIWHSWQAQTPKITISAHRSGSREFPLFTGAALGFSPERQTQPLDISKFCIFLFEVFVQEKSSPNQFWVKWFQFFVCSSLLGKWSNLTSIFFRWVEKNHQLEFIHCILSYSFPPQIRSNRFLIWQMWGVRAKVAWSCKWCEHCHRLLVMKTIPRRGLNAKRNGNLCPYSHTLQN